MSKQSLFEILSGEKPKGKVPIGYNVPSYSSVLSALQADKVIEIERHITAQRQAEIQRTFSVLGSTSLPKGMDVNGFLFSNDAQRQPFYQALCTVKDYMSFPVNCQTSEGQRYGWVKVDRGAALTNGISQKSGVTFPPSVLDENALTKLKESCTNLNIGAGISVGELGVKFFNTYFPDLKLTQAKLEKLVSKGFLYAEVLVPTVAGSAKVLHIKITINSSQCTTGGFDVWLPNPLLLLDDFSSLCNVKVNAGNGKGAEIVGNSSVTFPFASSKYNHQTASITGFTPSALEKYSKDQNSVIVSHAGCNLSNAGTEKHARIRLFFDEQARSEFSNISEEYAKELFRGKFRWGQLVDTDTIAVDGGLASWDGSGVYVILDVGHVPNEGAADWYALRNQSGGRNEYTYNYDMAHAVARKIEAAGGRAQVIDFPNNSNDGEFKYVKNISQNERYFAFISFHCNSYGPNRKDVTINDTDEGGSFVRVGASRRGLHPLSKELAETIAKHMINVMGGSKGSTQVKEQSLGVLQGGNRPKCLLEIAHINHKVDVDKLRNPQTFDRLATEITNGILEFYNKHKNE